MYTDNHPIECKAVKTINIQRHYTLQGTGNITNMAFAKCECQRREPKQLQAQQVAIVQKCIGGGNNSVIAIEEENDKREVPCQLVSPSTEVSESQLFNEDPIDELLINEVQFYRCLWDPRSRAYKETPKKAEAWKQISVTLGKSRE